MKLRYSKMDVRYAKNCYEAFAQSNEYNEITFQFIVRIDPLGIIDPLPIKLFVVVIDEISIRKNQIYYKEFYTIKEARAKAQSITKEMELK